MIPSDVVVALESIEWTHERVRTALEGLRDEQVGEPSRLPGWSRGHVLAHLAALGEAMVRQWQNAYEDAPVVPFYDGGPAGRDAAIEAGATASAAEHVARVLEHAHACTLTRGSIRPYSRSTSRFSSTKSTPIASTNPCTGA